MNSRSISHDEAMAEIFRKNPAHAIDVLNAILEEGDQSDLQMALRQMALAFGGATEVVERANSNGTPTHRTPFADGNPVIRNFFAALKAMDMRLALLPVQSAQTSVQSAMPRQGAPA